MLTVRIVGVTLLYFAACLGWGAAIVKISRLPRNHSIIATSENYLAVSYLSGLIFLASTWFVLSCVYLFYLNIVIIICLTGILFFFVLCPGEIYTSSRNIITRLRVCRDLNFGFIIVGIGVVVLFFLSFTVLGNELSGDASELYMAWPKIIASSHGLSPFPGRAISSTIGLFGEFHYAALLALGSPDACRLSDIFLVGLIIHLLLEISSILNIGKIGKIVVVSILFTSSAFIYLISKATADIYAFLFSIAAIFIVLKTFEKVDYPSLLIAGILSGTAINTKLSYIPGFLPVIVVLIGFSLIIEHRGLKPLVIFIKSVVFRYSYFLLGLLLGISPFFIKNAVIFGDPLISFSPWASQLLDIPVFKENSDIFRIIGFYPLMLTYGRFALQSGNISPLLIAFLPIGLLVGGIRKDNSRPKLMAVSISALIGLIIWVVLRPNVIVPRYYLAVLILFSFLPAAFVEALFQKQKTGIINFLIILSMLVTQVFIIMNFSSVWFRPKETIKYFLGSVGRCELDGFRCQALRVINREAKPGDRVLFANWFSYWLRPDLMQCMVTESDGIVYELTPQGEFTLSLHNELPSKQSFDDYWIQIYENGFKYLVVYKNDKIAILDSNSLNNLNWLELIPLYDDAKIKVFRLDFHNPPSSLKRECVETKPGLWNLISISD